MFGIITAYTDDPTIIVYGRMTSENKRKYCELHNYKYFEFDERVPKDLRHGPGWMKLPLIASVLKENPDVEWLFWIDSDAVIMNYRTRLESLIDDWAFIVVAQDCNGINVGTFFIRNCQLALDFIADVWTRGPQPGNWWTTSEQGQINYMGLMDKYRRGYSVVSNKKFNAYLHKCAPGVMYCAQYEPGDFAVHLPGLDKKEEILKVLLKNVTTV
jgi:hypothetical protein